MPRAKSGSGRGGQCEGPRKKDLMEMVVGGRVRELVAALESCKNAKKLVQADTYVHRGRRSTLLAIAAEAGVGVEVVRELVRLGSYVRDDREHAGVSLSPLVACCRAPAESDAAAVADALVEAGADASDSKALVAAVVWQRVDVALLLITSGWDAHALRLVRMADAHRLACEMFELFAQTGVVRRALVMASWSVCSAERLELLTELAAALRIDFDSPFSETHTHELRALHVACALRDQHRLEILVDRGVDVTQCLWDIPPMYFVISGSMSSAGTKFMPRVAESLQKREERGPVLDMLFILLAAGAEADRPARFADKYPYVRKVMDTPLELLCSRCRKRSVCDLDEVQLLLQAGAYLGPKVAVRDSPIHALTNGNSLTRGLAFCIFGPQLVRELISTPKLSLSLDGFFGDEQAVYDLLSNSGIMANYCDPRNRRSMLHLARSAGVVRLLCTNGADPNAKKISQATPLSVALRNWPRVVWPLLDAGADPELSLPVLRQVIASSRFSVDRDLTFVVRLAMDLGIKLSHADLPPSWTDTETLWEPR